MKPKKESSFFDSMTARFPPTPLYRSDLEQIIQMGSERGLKVTISDDRAEFDDLEDVKENRGDRVKDLTIRFAEPGSAYASIKLWIGSGGLSLRTSKDEKLLLAWHDMKAAIEKRVPFHARLMKPTLWSFVTVGVWGLASRLGWHLSQGFLQFAFILLPPYLAATSYIYVRKSGGIYLKREHEVESFWDRYGEKLLLLVAGAILAFLGNFAIQKLIGK